MTILSSVAVTVLLFLAREFVDSRKAALPSNSVTVATSPTNSRDEGAAPSFDRAAQVSGWTRSDTTWQTTELPSSSVGSPAPPSVTSRSTSQPADPSASQAYKVVGIIDGDTIDVLVNRQPLRLRLAAVDTPEKGQPFGSAAKKGLADLIGGKPVSYVIRDTDRYGRSIADVYVGTTHVNAWLVYQGLAWHYTAFSDDKQLAAYEQQAKAARRGLWSDPRSVAPWNWRKLSKVERDAYR